MLYHLIRSAQRQRRRKAHRNHLRNVYAKQRGYLSTAKSRLPRNARRKYTAAELAMRRQSRRNSA